MSTLTKVLVVLLTLSAIFLCGIVVTYAASAANYKLKHDDAVTENKSLSASASLLQTQLNEGLKAKQDEIASLQDQLNKLVAENGKLQSEALTLKAAKDELQERVNGWSGTLLCHWTCWFACEKSWGGSATVPALYWASVTGWTSVPVFARSARLPWAKSCWISGTEG